MTLTVALDREFGNDLMCHSVVKEEDYCLTKYYLHSLTYFIVRLAVAVSPVRVARPLGPLPLPPPLPRPRLVAAAALAEVPVAAAPAGFRPAAAHVRVRRGPAI